MAFQRFPLNPTKRHDPVSTEVRLRTAIADADLALALSRSSDPAIEEVRRILKEARGIR